MNIIYSKASVKVINSMDKDTKQRIRNAVERLPKGDVKPLSGSVRLYRLRVGGWRVVFYYPDSDTVLIEKSLRAAEHIRGVYYDNQKPAFANDRLCSRG